jgi:urease accessory protein
MAELSPTVMPALVAGIHVLDAHPESFVDDKPGHDLVEAGVSKARTKTLGDTFSANRAVGRVAFSVKAERGRTRRDAVHEAGSLRVRFPNVEGDECEAVLVNTAGGIAGGDKFDIAVTVGEGARLVAGGAAAEKVYRSHGPEAEIALRIDVRSGAALRWLPQETILFDRVGLSRSIEVDLAEDASLVLAEGVVFGRTAMDETVVQGRLHDRWRVRIGGRLVFAETLMLDGDVAEQLAAAAVGNGAAAIATVLIAPGNEAMVEAMRQGEFLGEIGVSAWNGIALARLCACDGAALRHDLIRLFARIDRGPLPRLWHS